MASPTPLGIHQIASSETYALVADLNRVGITADAAIQFVKDRAEYLTDKAVADAGALSRQALNEMPRHVASEVDRVIGDTREDAAEARSIAQQAYEYNQTLIAPVADVVNEIITDPNTAPGALVAAKVDESEGAILAHRMGATGNGVDDDTAALQAAIDMAEATGRPVWLAPGTYKVLGTLLLPPAVSIYGARTAGSVYGSIPEQSIGTRIKSYSSATFASKSTTTPSCYLTLRDVMFIDLSGDPRSVLFSGVNLRASRIENVTTGHYDVVFEGPNNGASPCLTGVSIVRNCGFVGVRESVTRGGVVDSKIVDNYLNGFSAKYNAVCFSIAGWSNSLVSGNYIDFFSHVFQLDGTSRMLMVTGNLFDYCYRVVGTNPTGGIRAMARTTFSANIIHSSSWGRAKTYFGAPTPEMQTEPWTAFDLAGVVGLSITGNVFHYVDRAFRADRFPYSDLQVRGNTFTDVTTIVEWEAIYLRAGDQQRIHIEPWHGSRVTTLPPASLTPEYRSQTYDGLELIYQGKRVYNDGGTWRDALGNEVTP